MDLKNLPVLVTDLTHAHIEHLKEFFANKFHGGDTLGQILGFDKKDKKEVVDEEPKPEVILPKFSVATPPKPVLPIAVKELKK